MELTRYINMFDTATAYTAAVENEELNYPNLSYVEETGAIHLDATAPTPTHDYSQDYFTIVSLVDGNNIDFVDEAGVMDNPISASTDGGQTWTAYDVQLLGRATIATLDEGEKVLVKVIQTDNTYEQNYGKVGFDIIGQYTIEGNIMSLVYGDNFATATTLPNDNMFNAFFSGDTNLVSAENLVLPATTLTTSCYQNMFRGCTSLTTAPELPATTLTTSCYQNMFRGCTNLVTAPSVLPATTLAYGCYVSMFQNCTSLTTAPELPAATLTSACYKYMFDGCISLNYVKCLATNINASSCLQYWVDGVASTGTFVKKSGVSWPSGGNGIPTGWTVQEV